ncbi:MAG: putative RNA methyltransferase [Eubacterium sp.]
MLICPVCKGKLNKSANALKCSDNHSFDYAKEGYVNLLLGSKNGDKRGDSKDSARARNQFLSKDYYICLKKAIAGRMRGTVLDICCGEGYYDDYIGTLYGFDISKEMVRLAAKRNRKHNYFVANLVDIPVESNSIDTAIHLFAPFNDSEFARVLKNDGTLYSVIPGENHLFEMKQVIYDEPYKNDEKAPESRYLKLVSRTKVSEKVSINQADLKELFSMTPYFYHTSDMDKAKLDKVDEMDLTVEFVILEYKK